MIKGLGSQQMEIKLFYVNDNDTNMKVAITESKYLKHYLCDIHTLQFAAKDTSVSGKQAVLNQSKAIATFASQSLLAITQLQNQCKELEISYKKPISPGDTRWSSQYDNMNSILPLRDPITWLCNNILNMREEIFLLLSGVCHLENLRK